MNNKILEEMKKLKIELNKIQNQNYIKSEGKGSSAAGMTLEKLLGKPHDNLCIADYNGIEIKTRNKYSRYPMTLFSCTFDNKPLQLQRLLNIGGYPDKNNPKFKVFQTTISAPRRKIIGKYSYKLHVNRKEKILELLVLYNTTNSVITTMSWSFNELENRINNKLKYLMIVEYYRTTRQKELYFKYKSPTFYQFRDFDTFLKLIESGAIVITFKLSYYHHGQRYGNYLDKGTSFDINYNKINELFKIIRI